MDDDKQAIVIGLAAGLGGFAGLLILGCICWQIVCGSWCEKKVVQPTVIPIRNQRRSTAVTQMPNNLSAITPMRSTNIHSNSKPSASNDLAGKVQSARR